MQFWSLKGQTDYEQVRALQLRLVDLRAQDAIADTFLLLEHRPVITRGKGLQFTGTPRPRHMPPPAFLPAGYQFAESERGGDLTYHGPGQLVIYPIVKLDGQGWGPKHDISGFLRKLEGALISDLAKRGLTGESRSGASGVWVGDRKVASVGIAIRKWVTYHGIAINCVNDLQAFHLISPCGFSPEVMTRMQDLDPSGQWSEDWRADFEARMVRELGGDPSSIQVVDLQALPPERHFSAILE